MCLLYWPAIQWMVFCLAAIVKTIHMTVILCSFKGIQTPQRRISTSYEETEATIDTHSPFASFITDFHDFKNRMTSGGDTGTHRDSSNGINTPVSCW